VKKVFGCFYLLLCFAGFSNAGLPDFGVGYELIKGKYYSPDYTANWSWNDDWQVQGNFQKSQFDNDLNFSFLFLRFGKTKVLSNTVSAGFETGFYVPVSASENSWQIPFCSTGSAPSTEYNWQVSPSTYSALYNYENRKLFILPLMGRLDFDFSRLLKISAAAGFYLTHLEVAYTEGEEFKIDHTEIAGSITKEFRAGDVQEYRYWLQQTNLIPALKLSLSSWIKLSSDMNLDFSLSAGWLRKTEFLYSEFIEGIKLKDGYEIGGLSYSFAFGISVLF